MNNAIFTFFRVAVVLVLTYALAVAVSFNAIFTFFRVAVVLVLTYALAVAVSSWFLHRSNWQSLLRVLGARGDINDIIPSTEGQVSKPVGMLNRFGINAASVLPESLDELVNKLDSNSIDEVQLVPVSAIDRGLLRLQ
jgi:hypothetical protein